MKLLVIYPNEENYSFKFDNDSQRKLEIQNGDIDTRIN